MVFLRPGDPERFNLRRLGAKWDPGRGFWVLPLSEENLIRLTSECPRILLHRTLRGMIPQRPSLLRDEFREEVSVPGLKGDLFPFQRRGVAWIERCQGRALIADEPGTGKTIQALAWLQLHPEARPALVVCPAVVRGNWVAEARGWLEARPENDVTEIRSGKNVPGSGITVCNYDLVHRLPDDYRPVAVVMDECHYIKSPSARRSKVVAGLAKRARYVVALSGTPMLNRPAELFSVLNVLRPDIWRDRRSFEIRYCGGHLAQAGYKRFWRADGATNIPELASSLRKNIMIRRCKDDVLGELPVKIRQFVDLPLDSLSNAQEYLRAEEDFAAWLLEHKLDRAQATGAKAAPWEIMKTLRAEALVKLGALRKLAGMGKVVHTLRWAEDFLEGSDSKLVIFAHHQDVQEAILVGLRRFGVARLAAGNDYRRETLRFQSDRSVRVAVCSLKAAGQGVTLTAASHMLLCELDWTPAILEQAEDRIHRIGQERACTYTYIVSSETVDRDMLDALGLKRIVLNKTIDQGGV